VLAFCSNDKDESAEEKPSRGHKHNLSSTSTGSEPSGGIKRKQNNAPPELRLIDLTTHEEVYMDVLSVSRFERLSSNDYHLGVLPARNVAAAISTRGALETLAGFGTDMLNAALNPKALLFSSGASVRSKDSNDGASGTSTSTLRPGTTTVHPSLGNPGLKIFIHSPYDCVLATQRDLGDHLQWLLEHHQYQESWELVDEHPEIVGSPERSFEQGTSPEQTQATDDFYDDTASVAEGMNHFYSSAEKEKRRIGELWVKQLIDEGDWALAGQICGKVVRTPDKWETWVWRFAGANKFDEIVNYIPCEPTHPPIPTTIYEVILNHYLKINKPMFRDLLDRWPPELFNVSVVAATLEDQIKYREVREDSVEDGEVGRDWRIVMESLAKLHEASGRNREALKCYIKLQDADSAMRLVADDIPSFIGLRVPPERRRIMTPKELEEATSEAITLLVDEAQHGLVKPEIVVNQLQAKEMHLYTFFYLRGLWSGDGIHEHGQESRARLVFDSQSMVDAFADLAVRLFALFDQPLLMTFLKTSTAYTFETVCPLSLPLHPH
jgi:vacuolar protein sorting-associated protein 41